MPHIFPRRFLRTRDILETHEMNEDVRPVQELLDGNLDRQNFDGEALKALLKPTPTVGFPSVADGAYYNVYTSNLESRYRFHRGSAEPGNIRTPPNFVQLNGSTLRDPITGTFAKPYVVPNSGEWSVVKNANLTAPQQITMTTGQSKVWVCAYAQYIWQGFYEWKLPYISSAKKIGGKDVVRVPPEGRKWDQVSIYNRKLLDIMNLYGPQTEWESLPSAGTPNKDDKVRVYSHEDLQYAFPLNEITSKNEAINPNLGGFHHISQGFYPALVQFAIRVDGKIIEESITGKQFTMEESVHGLQVGESPAFKGDANWFRFGQRGQQSKVSFSPFGGARPGQKVSSSRAVSCGPEVMPVRLGALVALEPGDHTIELVVRRLSRKSLKFQAGDFVGVFSRRLIAFDLPLVPPRSEDKEPSITVPNFEVEDTVTEDNLTTPREDLADRLNAVKPSDVFRGSLPNTHLPSKVVFSKSTTLTPSFSVRSGSGFFASDNLTASPQARFPGFTNTSILDRTVSSPTHGWPTDVNDFSSSSGAGWYMLQDTLSTQKLQIVSSGTDLTLSPGQKLLLFADIELRGFEHILSAEAHSYKTGIGEEAIGSFRAGISGAILPERYLDLFALFAIGYKVGSDWTIASESVPAMVNSFNWVNRGFGFCSSNGSDTSGISTGSYNSGLEEGVSPIQPGLILEQMDLRSGHTLPNNLGINVPIVQIIEATNATGTISISEVAGFMCSEIPSNWTNGPEGGSPDWTEKYFWWRPRASGRRILRGLRVHYGNSRLSAIKINK
tara:strand:- start:1994 stop:4336 length:2343 start_codon:yes stop_codon:yes gene_type:complete